MTELLLNSDYRIVAIDGLVSTEVYSLKRLPDQKLIVVIESRDGKSQRVHHERIIPVDCYNKEVIVGKVLKTVCRRCGKLSDITADDYVDCSCSTDRLPVQRSSSKQNTNVKDSTVMANKAPAVIDLRFVASHGLELWGKESQFDHVVTSVMSFALLADGPPRKLCFQTYNGTLGKKASDLGRLNLGAFKDNSNHNGKPPWSVVKGTLDDERKRLSSNGYAKMDLIGSKEEGVKDAGSITDTR